jgi:hypothetical protein
MAEIETPFRYTVTPVTSKWETEWMVKTRMGKIMIPAHEQAQLLARTLNMRHERLSRPR